MDEHNQEKQHDNTKVLGPASLGKRLANYVIDRIGTYIFAFLIMMMLPNSALLFIIIIMFGYYLLFEGIWQKTPGKWITKTKIVRRDETKPSFGQILGRTFARLIPFEPISFLVGAPIGWHDSLSKTLVVPKNYTEEDVRNIDIEKARSSKLLIVLAIIIGFILIIAILSTIVLASLNGARQRAIETKMQAESNMQIQNQ